MIDKILEFRFTYRPFDKTFPIRSIDIYIRAKTRKEAEIINIENNYKFFNQDCSVEVAEFPGYIQLFPDEPIKP
jgi:hypothetical protein